MADKSNLTYRYEKPHTVIFYCDIIASMTETKNFSETLPIGFVTTIQEIISRYPNVYERPYNNSYIGEIAKYIAENKDMAATAERIEELSELCGLSTEVLSEMFFKEVPKEPNSNPANGLVDELVHKANEEIRNFVNKVIGGEIVLTESKLQECIGYIKRKLVLAQLSLSVEVNTIDDQEVANLAKTKAHAIKLQIDSLESTMKLLLADTGNEDSSLIESNETAKEI